MHDSSTLVISRKRVGNLADGVRRCIARSDFDFNRVVEAGPGQLAYIAAEGGREQQGLPLYGQKANNAFEIRQEPHIQHAIGFVEHQDANLTQIDITLLDVIQQTAWRGNKHFATTTQGIALRPDIYPAKHNRRPQWRALAILGDVIRYLICQLARRRED